VSRFNTQEPLVSIVIPSRNSEQTIERCLESVERQTYGNVEIVLIDNYSNDKTREIGKRFGARIYLKGPERSAQVNFGAEVARGKYIYRIDSDFLLQENVIQEAVDVSEKFDCDAIVIHNTSDPTASFWAKIRKIERDCYKYDQINAAARFWKKEIFISAGGFDETLFAAEDYNLHNRIVKNGSKVGRIHSEEVHIGEPSTLTEIVRKQYYYGKNMLRFIQSDSAIALKQISPVRLGYIRNWRHFLNDPALIPGFVLYQSVRYAASALGSFSSLVDPRPLTLTANRTSFPKRISDGLVETASLSKKRITLVLPKVSYEGVAKVGLIQANILKTWFHHDVEVISLIKEKRKFEEFLGGLNVKYACPVAAVSRGFYHVLTSFTKTAPNLILAHNIPAIVMAHKFLERQKIPYIAYVHDSTFDRIPGSLPTFGYRRIKKALDNSSMVLTNSLKTLRKLYDIYRVEGLQLYPGCFPAERVNCTKSDFFLYVHFISKRASYKFLISLLEKEDFNLVIAGGRRWGWQGVLHSFQKFGDRVKFVFEPTENDLSILYQRAKGLIFPEVENFGLSPLEAGAQGCPSIVAEGSGVLEILQKGEEALAYKEGSIEGFGKAIRTLKENPNYVRHIGTRAWVASKKSSWSEHASKLIQNIETL